MLNMEQSVILNLEVVILNSFKSSLAALVLTI